MRTSAAHGLGIGTLFGSARAALVLTCCLHHKEKGGGEGLRIFEAFVQASLTVCDAACRAILPHQRPLSVAIVHPSASARPRRLWFLRQSVIMCIHQLVFNLNWSSPVLETVTSRLIRKVASTVFAQIDTEFHSAEEIEDREESVKVPRLVPLGRIQERIMEDIPDVLVAQNDEGYCRGPSATNHGGTGGGDLVGVSHARSGVPCGRDHPRRVGDWGQIHELNVERSHRRPGCTVRRS